jgi:ADP-ribose pyrophosphatase
MPRTRSNPQRTVLNAGRFLQFVREDHWEFVERRNATGVVAIVAVTDPGELVLTEQFRKPVQASVIDLPAGLAGDDAATESLADAARRELLEETGFEARRFVRIASAPTSPGLTSEIVTFFRALRLKRVGSGGGSGDERIRTHCVKLTSAATWLQRRARSGLAIDLKVYAGLYFAERHSRAGRA